MSNIEDDVKILKEFNSLKVNSPFRFVEISYPRLQKAISNILSDYTRQKQINEEHQKINGGLREKVKELEEERQLVGMLVKNKRDGRIGIVLHQWENGSVTVLESINPRVINTHDSWNTLEIITDEVKQVQTQENSIPKQVVIDKMEELNKEIKSCDEIDAIFKIKQQQILQELLEGAGK